MNFVFHHNKDSCLRILAYPNVFISFIPYCILTCAYGYGLVLGRNHDLVQLISITENLTQTSFLTFSQRRIDKILDYAARQWNKSKLDKKRDFQRLTKNQKMWVENRMKGPQRSWERWNDQIEEWEPWGFLGSPVNKWSNKKSK